MHVHVAKAGADAKLWLWPEVHFAYNRGLNPREQRRVLQLAMEYRSQIEEAWNEFFA